MGRDTSWSRSISWRANGSIARWSAPGWWSVTNENAVRQRLAVHVEPHVGRDGDEARERLRVVADVVGDDGEPVQARGALARDRDLRRIAVLGDVRGRVGGRRGRDRGRSGIAASSMRHWSSATGCEWTARTCSSGTSARPDEEVPDREDGLAGDRERRVVEEVVRLGDGPASELSIGSTPTSIVPSAVACVTAAKLGSGDELGAVREEAVARGRAVGAVASGVADDRGCRRAFGHRPSEGSKESRLDSIASRRRRERNAD